MLQVFQNTRLITKDEETFLILGKPFITIEDKQEVYNIVCVFNVPVGEVLDLQYNGNLDTFYSIRFPNAQLIKKSYFSNNKRETDFNVSINDILNIEVA